MFVRRKWRLSSQAVLISGLFMVGCGSSSPGGLDNTAPAIPTGFTAIPGDTTVALSWNANTESDVSGYDVYQGTTSGSLTKTATVNVPTTTYNATGLTNGTTYYFALKAVDTANNASAACDEVAVAPAAPDTTSPTVAMTQPATTTDVALDTEVTLTFSENMNPGTVTATFTPSVTFANSEWTDGMTLVLTPDTALTQNTSYSVAVEGQDLTGNALSGTTTFSFTTVNTAPPEVLNTSPADSAANVPVTANISFSFSKPMARSSVEGAFTAAPNITCAWAWGADSTLATCTHVADLSASTPYSITLGTGACDQATSPHCLVSDYTFSFGTAAAADVTPPTVSSSTPAASATGVSRYTNITVVFSEAMDKASAQAAFSILSPTGHNAGVFSWNAAGTQMTFNPDVDFSYGNAVSWRVSTAAEDLAGNTMAASYNSSFTVIRQGTASLYSVAALDGYIGSNSYLNTSNSGLAVGDGSDNVFYRAFFSFDLSSLPSTLTSITSATLYAYQYLVWNDDPYAHLGLLKAESVYYGSSLTTADFETSVDSTSCCYICLPHPLSVTLSNSSTNGWKSTDVLCKVRYDWTNKTARGSRAQFRLKFPTNTDTDGHYDIVNMYTGDATSGRPQLNLVYEYP